MTVQSAAVLIDRSVQATNEAIAQLRASGVLEQTTIGLQRPGESPIARVAGLVGEGEVLASRTVKDLAAGSGYRFTSRGTHSLKGVPEEWELLAVT